MNLSERCRAAGVTVDYRPYGATHDTKEWETTSPFDRMLAWSEDNDVKWNERGSICPCWLLGKDNHQYLGECHVLKIESGVNGWRRHVSTWNARSRRGRGARELWIAQPYLTDVDKIMEIEEIQALIRHGMDVRVTIGWYLPPHTTCVEVRRGG